MSSLQEFRLRAARPHAHIDLYDFYHSKSKSQRPTEVVIEKLEYLPEKLVSVLRLRRWLLIGVAAVCFFKAAHALNPSKAVSQYVHDKWGADRGFLGGAIFAISQSRDGYLWIGTERGLVRFDGFDFTLIQHPLSGSQAIGAVRGLAADADGNLWICLDGPHLLRYTTVYSRMRSLDLDCRKLRSLPCPWTATADCFSGVRNDDCCVSATENFGSTESRTIFLASSFRQLNRVTENLDGYSEIGLFQVDNGRSINILRPRDLTSINTVLPTTGNKVWIGTDAGLKVWDDHGLSDPAAPPSIGQFQILALTKDRQGNVWAGTRHGLIRITPLLAFSTELVNRTAGSEITAIYEDRDGDIWFGGTRGIERLRDGMFTGYSAAQGLPRENNGPVYVDSDNTEWFAPASGGLYWLKDKGVGHVTVDGLDRDVIYSISGGDGELWVGRQHGGLTRLAQRYFFIAQTYKQADGLAQNSIYSVHRCRDGTIWLGQ